MYPKIGQNIMIKMKAENLSCKSIIVDIGEEEMLIAVPMTTDFIGRVSVDSQLEISFVVKDQKYQFDTVILGWRKEKILLFQIKKPLETEIVKIQQRQDFRVKAALPVYLMDTEQSTINISAGGILCSVNSEFAVESDKEVSGQIVLSNEGETVRFKGRIVRVNRPPNQNRTFVAMKFTDLDQVDQIKIRQFCFEKQRQSRHMV